MSRILFGVHETCGILNMSRTALYAAIKQGRIKAVKNGFRIHAGFSLLVG